MSALLAEHPTIAIVDYEDVPTRTEHHLFREFFSDSGYPAFVCDPRDLTYEKVALRYEGRTIDIVYKRLLVNELIERADKLQALISRDPFHMSGSTEELHKQVYGDSSLAHAPSPEPKYEFSDDPLAEGGFEGDSIRVKPGPVRTTLIKPKGPDLKPKASWLKNALEQDPLLKKLPDWAREKAIGALEDIDETIAEKIIDALPWDANVKSAATAALKALLQTAKGKKFELPPSPPSVRAPDWSRQPDFQPSPGQVIIPGPVWRW